MTEAGDGKAGLVLIAEPCGTHHAVVDCLSAAYGPIRSAGRRGGRRVERDLDVSRAVHLPCTDLRARRVEQPAVPRQRDVHGDVGDLGEVAALGIPVVPHDDHLELVVPGRILLGV